MDGFMTWVSAATFGNKLKQEFKDTFDPQPQREGDLPYEYHPSNDETYDKELHQSWSSKRASQAHLKSIASTKSSAVKEAQARRAAAAAKASGSKR